MLHDISISPYMPDIDEKTGNVNVDSLL